jgi:hypothetical protein
MLKSIDDTSDNLLDVTLLERGVCRILDYVLHNFGTYL